MTPVVNNSPGRSGPSDPVDPTNHRILIVDDMQCIHDDFRKILIKENLEEIEKAEAALFDSELAAPTLRRFLIDSAYQGKEGLELLRGALAQAQPYTLAFVDVRMPPGWDGIETARRLWEADPHLQIIMCSAYSDYSWDEMSRTLGNTDSLVFLKKPFDAIEVMQLVHALTRKWSLSRQIEQRVADLDCVVAQRTEQLRLANEELLTDISVRKNTELRLAAFASLGIRLSAAQNAKAAAEIIFEVADKLLGWDACICNLYSPKEDRLFHILGMDIIDGRKTECGPAYINDKPAGLALKAIHEGGQLVLRDDPANCTSEFLPFGDEGRRSASILFVPIRNGAAIIGFISIQSYKIRAYDERSLETLQALADHCGGALNRIKSDETLRETESQLRQAQKMEAIGQLAGGVAHDFNNLLAVILGNTELARMNPSMLSPSVAEHLKEVVDAANRAATLTRQLLAFSRKEVVQAQPLDLNKHIGNLASLLKRTIRENVELRYTFTEDLSLVQADPVMLDQVFMNLVVNARDAMPGGGHLRIATDEINLDASTVRSHSEGRPGRFVCVSVEDSGAGIAPEHLAHIFEPFFTTKEVGKGTGLGLATVFGVVKQHRGWVEVTSAVGVGTKFQIFLPALDRIGVSSAQAPQNSAVQGGQEVVLMVEDDDSVRRIFRSVLEEAGYRPLEASCGREALDVWETHRNEIGLLLTDVVMPGGIDGRDLAERLIALRPDLKVLFMTGYRGDILDENAEILKRSNSRMLKKPCGRKEFLRVVREHLDDNKPQRVEIEKTTCPSVFDPADPRL